MRLIIVVLIETLWNVKIGTATTFPAFFGINRNIVECKDLFFPFQPGAEPRINRNIVECKDACKQFYQCIRCRINRNIVECKVKRELPAGKSNPCINRNIVECKANSVGDKMEYWLVLIETLWNVKMLYGSCCPARELCINRNIVECKDQIINFIIDFILVLIETLWNVKSCIPAAVALISEY